MTQAQKRQQAENYRKADQRDAAAFLLFTLSRQKHIPAKRPMLLSGLAGFNRNVQAP